MDLGRLSEALSPELIAEVLRDPRTYRTEATLLLAIVVVLVLFIVVALILAAFPPERRGEEPPSDEDDETAGDPDAARRRRSWLAAAAVAAVALAVFAAGWVHLGNPETCESCHGGTEIVASWEDGPHGESGCFDCHAAPGVMGAASGRLSVAGDEARSLAGAAPYERDALVLDDACLGCHEDDIAETIVVASVRVSHTEILEGGYPCVECHAGVTHGGATKRDLRPAMATCLPCHDGALASAACETCHVDDVGLASTTALRSYPKIEPLGKPTSCRGCHETESCDECHGLELPHSSEFVEGAHAPQAAFDRKEVCLPCHDPSAFCNRCHRFEPDGSATHSFQAHYALPGCGCHGVGREEFCARCH